MKPKCKVEGCDGEHEAFGYCRQHYKRFKLHGDPLVQKRAPNGAGWLQRGYRIHTQDGKKIPEHRRIVEGVLGKPLPPTAVIHHVDENRLNNAHENLVVCPSVKYHKLLHQRMDARAACGNPNWRKCPFCYQYDDPSNMRDEKVRFVHVECSNRAQRERRHGLRISPCGA